MSRPLLAVVLLAVVVAMPSLAHAEPQKAEPADRATVEACLKLVERNAQEDAKGKTEDEKPGPEGRLAAAAKDAATDPTSCIGAVASPCQQQPGGYSTAGMVGCFSRELAVWDERLNAAYKERLKAADKKYTDVVRAAQRAWLQWRAHKCRLPALENEGGSIVGPLTAACHYEATARQALWLEGH